jgi:hypothetical protein
MGQTLKKVIVVKDLLYAKEAGVGTAIADHNEIDLLDEGAFAIFTDANALVTPTTVAADLLTVKQFKIVAKGNKDLTQTILIDRDAFHRAKCVYVAPVKHVLCVGASTALGTGASNLPASPVVRTIASLQIIVENVYGVDTTLVGRTEFYDYQVKTGDTPQIILQALVDKINANVNSVATAALDATNDGIIITAKDFGVKLLVTTDDILIDADRQVDVNINYGKGTAAQVLEEEQESFINDGNTNRIHKPQFYFNTPSEVDGAGTYTSYSLTWKAEARNSINSQNVAVNTVTLYVPSGASTLITAIDTMLTALKLVPGTGAGSSQSPL